MTRRLALVICPEGEQLDAVNHKLLGLTIGERLLLTLERVGMTHVAFAGNGARPTSNRTKLTIVDVASPPPFAKHFYLFPADLVFDAKLFEPDVDISKDIPMRKVSMTGWKEISAGTDDAFFELGVGPANTGAGFAIRVADKENAKLAEKALIRSLTKPADGIISRNLNRKISTFISKRLSKFPITPNQITFVVFLVGVISGPLAYLGTPLGFALGGFCYWFSAVLDGCDGEVSRLKFQGSPMGAWLDTIVDDIACLSYITGMYLALRNNDGGPMWAWVGAVAVLFFMLTVLPRYYIMAARSGSGDYQKMAKETRPENKGALSRFLLGVRDVVFRTDFLPFAGMVTAVIGYPEIFAWPFAVGAIASSVDTFVTIFRYNAPSEVDVKR